MIEELFKFNNQNPNNIVTELKVAGSKIAFILSDWSNRTAVLHVFDGEVEVLVHAVSFDPFEGPLLANDGEWSTVLRRDLPGASLFNLATRAYSHDVDFVEASRVHDILIIEYPTLILCSDSRALVYTRLHSSRPSSLRDSLHSGSFAIKTSLQSSSHPLWTSLQ